MSTIEINCAPSAAATSARDTGCSECCARLAAICSACCEVTPARTCIARKPMLAWVRVPVLSKITVSMLARDSIACIRRTSTPWRANRPADVNIAAGVANDSAQGHVTTSTATAAIKARAGSVGHQNTTAKAAASSTKIKNGLATLSASTASRGLSVDACAISDTIWA